ncbi:hypothetical protein EV361DRAFT_873876 [Lentinula raphanica]|nr:hypothetical protein EV361DRAFT_873876 [Lentinula raphanica]
MVYYFKKAQALQIDINATLPCFVSEQAVDTKSSFFMFYARQLASSQCYLIIRKLASYAIWPHIAPTDQCEAFTFSGKISVTFPPLKRFARAYNRLICYSFELFPTTHLQRFVFYGPFTIFQSVRGFIAWKDVEEREVRVEEQDVTIVSWAGELHIESRDKGIDDTGIYPRHCRHHVQIFMEQHAFVIPNCFSNPILSILLFE